LIENLTRDHEQFRLIGESKLADLVTILDRKFLEFLELRLVRLCQEKVSVVFEDLQSRPITETPGVRVFPKRNGKNICECMIDCPKNEHAQRLCMNSDQHGARMATAQKKGYLYKCHNGKGFPNFLFPITIWPDEVIGYLYVGQFVFKELRKEERDALIKRLEKSDYIMDDSSRFASEWYDIDYDSFWEYIIPHPLNKERDFKKEPFTALIKYQIENYGVSPQEFFDIIELIQGLARNLSTLGNSVYLLMSLCEIERRLPSLLKAKYDSGLSELREAIASAVERKDGTGIDVHKTVETIADKSLAILMACKTYEDKYLRELIRPYKNCLINPNDEVRDWILQFYARSLSFETILFCKLRTKTYLRKDVAQGDELVRSFFNVLASCGHHFQTFRELAKELFLRMYQENEVKFHLKGKFVPCVRLLFDQTHDLNEWLAIHRIADLDIEQHPESIGVFPRTFDVFIRDLESLHGQLKKINEAIIRKLDKVSRIQSLDIGDFSEHVRTVNELRVSLSNGLSYDKFGTRKCLDQKAYKVFLNSGGLTATHASSLNELAKWTAFRNEEGPIGTTVERELEKKIEKTRHLLAGYIGAESSGCLIFTQNTTSAIDLAMRSVLKPGDEVLTTDLEHNVVYYLTRYYQQQYDCSVVTVDISSRLLKGEEWIPHLVGKIGQRTKLIILSQVLYSTGFEMPIKRIIDECRKTVKKRQCFILVDGAHAVGNVRVDVKSLGCDFYAFDGHKWLLGPEGIGVLYCKENYLKSDNTFGVNLPLPTAFMVAPAYSPRRADGQKYELGTMDAAKFIALAPVIESSSKLKFSETSKWRIGLVRKLHENLRNSRWKIINLKESLKTGMLCLQIEGCESAKVYELTASLLERSNIIVRWLKTPPCIRICLHHFNNETDIQVAASCLNALLEGFDIHSGNHKVVEAKLKDIILAFFQTPKPTHLTTLVGLNLFSIAGAGKTHVFNKIRRDLKSRGVSSFSFNARRLLKSEKPEKEFAQLLDRAKKNAPSLVIIDEADSLFGEKQEDIRATFNQEYNRILKQKVVFVISVNDPDNIHEAVKSRLELAYFPLPDFTTRLRLLRRLFRGTSCSNQVLLTQIARLTERYSMRDLKRLREKTIEVSKGSEIKPEHFRESLQTLKPTASDEVLQKYTRLIKESHPRVFTGQIQAQIIDALW
jgi:L-cysteine/cystine lyase